MASLGLILVIGVATFFNFAVILYKFNKGNTANALLDVAVFAVITFMFIGSVSALAIGMVASMLFSIYLIFTEVKTPSLDKRRDRKIRI